MSHFPDQHDSAFAGAELYFLVDKGCTVTLSPRSSDLIPYHIDANHPTAGKFRAPCPSLGEGSKEIRLSLVEKLRQSEPMGLPSTWSGVHEVQLQGRAGWVKICIENVIFDGNGFPMFLELTGGSSLNFHKVIEIRKAS